MIRRRCVSVLLLESKTGTISGVFGHIRANAPILSLGTAGSDCEGKYTISMSSRFLGDGGAVSNSNSNLREAFAVFGRKAASEAHA
jgi:hypothetical protein